MVKCVTRVYVSIAMLCVCVCGVCVVCGVWCRSMCSLRCMHVCGVCGVWCAVCGVGVCVVYAVCMCVVCVVCGVRCVV